MQALADRGWQAMVGTELEFIVFRDSYEDAWRKGYRDLQPANDYNVDYSLLGTARIEPLLRAIRNGPSRPSRRPSRWRPSGPGSSTSRGSPSTTR